MIQTTPRSKNCAERTMAEGLVVTWGLISLVPRRYRLSVALNRFGEIF
jgi:hypothetical protein